MKIEAPTNCPCCGSTLERVKDTLFCRNDLCEAKIDKKIEHFAKTLKIKGLGPATIKKLELESLDQLYDLDEKELRNRIGSDRLAEKLFEELDKSINEPLNSVLPALGIPLVGKSASSKLSKVCDSIFDISYEDCKNAGLGEVVTNNLLDWLETTDLIYKLPFSFEFEKIEEPAEVKGVICISGRLKTFKTKAEAEKALVSAGYVVKSSLTKDVTILINESGIESTKTKKASNSGITIINNIKEIIGDN